MEKVFLFGEKQALEGGVFIAGLQRGISCKMRSNNIKFKYIQTVKMPENARPLRPAPPRARYKAAPIHF